MQGSRKLHLSTCQLNSDSLAQVRVRPRRLAYRQVLRSVLQGTPCRLIALLAGCCLRRGQFVAWRIGMIKLAVAQCDK